jgi:hypothetical protein
MLIGHHGDYPPPLENGPVDEKIVTPPQVAPSRDYKLPAYLPPPAGNGGPASRDVKPIEFRQSAPMPTPGPLPELLPPEISALPTTPGVGLAQAGRSGFVTIEEPLALPSRLGPQGDVITPRFVRAASAAPATDK